jgi:hypothetical protein
MDEAELPRLCRRAWLEAVRDLDGAMVVSVDKEPEAKAGQQGTRVNRGGRAVGEVAPSAGTQHHQAFIRAEGTVVDGREGTRSSFAAGPWRVAKADVLVTTRRRGKDTKSMYCIFVCT